MNLNTTIKTGLFMAACCLSMNAYSQDMPTKKFGKAFPADVQPCGTTEYEALLQKKNPKRAATQQFEKWLAPKVAAAKAKRMQKDGNGTNEVVTIPVVFHVVHNGDAIGVNENIAEGQILSQITVLNQDFRRMEGTPGFNTNPVGADMEIEFCMAQRDPYGVASTGIVRYNMGDDNGWSMEEVEMLKAQTQWDPEKYLNIWVVDEIYSLAGYAQFPTQSGLEGLTQPGLPTAANTDGVALGHLYVGSKDLFPEGTYDETPLGRNKGRSASHEVGHFFGLRHIWGDENNCTADDYCADTPIHLTATSSCPTGPVDTCPAQPGNDMTENYMDYTPDECLNIFTLNQKDRMQAVLANSPRRNSLITSNSCTPGTATINNDGSLHLVPFNTNCGTTFTPEFLLRNLGATTITSAVVEYSIDGGAPVQYTWTGSLAAGAQERVSMSLMSEENGDHNFSIELISINGAADEIAANNSGSITFFIDDTLPNYDTETITITIQPDAKASEIGWLLMDSNQNILAQSDLYEDAVGGQPAEIITETIEVGINSCYIFLIADNGGNGICCTNGDGYYHVRTEDGTTIAEGGEFDVIEFTPFSTNIIMNNNDVVKTLGKIILYPNPANSILTIAANAADMPESYTIYNSLGQVIGEGRVTTATQTVDVASYAYGVYFVKVAKGDQSKTMQFIKN